MNKLPLSGAAAMLRKLAMTLSVELRLNLALKLTAAFVLILTVATSAQAAPLKALLLTSPGVYHDYEAQMQTISKALANKVALRIDVSLAETERWKTSDFGKGYDVILYNLCMADETDPELIANMRKQTEVLGIPAIVLHCTMHSFRTTDKWWPLYGLKTVAHENIGEMPQQHVGDHPVLTAIPKDWHIEHDELYINLAFKAQPLLTSPGDDGKPHVTAWTQVSNGTRIFGTTLGHSMETLEDPIFQQLLTNGLLWVTHNMHDNGSARDGLGPNPANTVLGKIAKAPGVDFMDEDARSCMQKEMFWAIGPCYIGCTLNPLIWGEDATQCKEACVAQIPDSNTLIQACANASSD